MKNTLQILLRSLWAGVIVLASQVGAPMPAYAQQVPDRLNYQGMLRKGDGTPEPAGYKDIEFRIYDAPTGGALQWAHSHRVNLDTNGLFNVVLNEGGSPITTGDPRFADLTSVFTASDSQNRYLELTVLPGSNPIQPRQRFVSAAYAFQAADVTHAKENFTVMGSLTVQSGAHVNALTVDTAATLNNATILGDMQIGTSSADYQHLSLGGGNSWGYLYGSYKTLGDGIHLGYNYYVDASGNDHIIRAGGGTSRLTVGYGQILLATGPADTAPSYRMKVAENGNVGMGTTSPKAGLHIERGSDDTQPALLLSSSSLGQGSGLWLQNRGTGTPNTWSIYTASNESRLHIANQNLSKDAIVIATNLNVGIRCAQPQAMLEVQAGCDSTGARVPSAMAFSWYGGGYRHWIRTRHNSNADYGNGIDFYVNTGRSADDSSGPGINSTLVLQMDSTNVYVAGQLQVGGMPSGTGSTVRYDRTTGMLRYDSSSQRYKENIHPLETDWFALLGAEPVTYTRPGSSNVWEIGFIAEDFDALGLQPLVLYDEAGRPDGIQYDRITLYLAQIAKAQQKELAEKTARLEALEQSVAEVKAMFNALAEKVNGGAR